VRFVYLDETGTGDPRVEPWLIVAGVMVHEKRWKAVERHLIGMADAFAVPSDRGSFCFHANELFTGGKKDFKAKYPFQKRHDALAALCAIPEQFSLPVFMYAVNRAKYVERYGANRPADVILTEQLMHMSIACASGVETFMKQTAEDDDVATLIYEQNGQKSAAVRAYHNLFRSDLMKKALEQLRTQGTVRLVHFERIIETALFAAKTDSSLLQIADACAYVFGRRMRGAGIGDRFYAPIRRQLVYGHKEIMSETGYART
jgi:hypothetical protein